MLLCWPRMPKPSPLHSRPSGNSTDKINRIAIATFLMLNCLYVITSTGRVRVTDEVMTLFQSQSLVRRATTAVPQAVAARLFYGKFDKTGRPRAPYPPGQAIAAAPWYAMGDFLLRHLPGVPAEASDLMLGFAITLSSATFAALAAAFSFLLFVRLGIAVTSALFSTAIIGLGMPLFAYSGWFFSEPLTCALLIGAALLLFGRDRDQAIDPRSALLAGVLLGCAVLVRPTHAIAAPVFAVAILARDKRQGLATAALAMLPVALALAGYLYSNYRMFGDPMEFGYPAVAEGGKHLNTFETPLATGLYGFLLSPGKSIFLYAPPILLAVAGLRSTWDRDHGLAALASVSTPVYLVFYSRYTQWEGGYCYGPRYMLPALMLLALCIGPLLDRLGASMRGAAVVLLFFGAGVQWVGLSTSFVENEANGTYYDRQWNYRMEHNALVGQAKLFAKYAGSDTPARIGLGMDRWFVFLHKGGVSDTTIAFLMMVPFAGLVASGWMLRRDLRELS